MQGNSVAEVLRALAISDKARSETARLRDVVGEVEAALSAGVSRAAVLAALHGQGFTMTPKSFESALYRLRKQREKSNPRPPEILGTPGTNPATASTAPEATETPNTPALGGGFKAKAERKANQYFGGNPLDFNVSDVLTKKEK